MILLAFLAIARERITLLVNRAIDRIPSTIQAFREAQLRYPPGDCPRIAVSRLRDHDQDGKQTRRVVGALGEVAGIEVLAVPRSLRVAEVGIQSEAKARAITQGVRWLKGRNADILICGEVVKSDEVLKLWSIDRTGESSRDKPYEVKLGEIAEEFEADLKNLTLNFFTRLAEKSFKDPTNIDLVAGSAGSITAQNVLPTNECYKKLSRMPRYEFPARI